MRAGMTLIPYATGVAKRPSCKMIGKACRRSRRYTRIAETISVDPAVNRIWITSSMGTQTDVGFGMNPVITRSTPKTATDIEESNVATAILDSGKTSLGQYTLFKREGLAIRLWPPTEREVEKYVHGISPR